MTPPADAPHHRRRQPHHPFEGEDQMTTSRPGVSGATGTAGAHTPGAER